jgi:hypothetical protein
MAGNPESADLIDPGVLDIQLQKKHMPTDSQIQHFCEVELLNNDLTLSLNGNAAPNTTASTGKKRKGSMQSGEEIMADGNGLRKRPNVQCRFAEAVEGSENQRTPTTYIQESRNAADHDNSRVVLIRPASEDAKRMLISPEQLCIALEAPPFNAIHIKDVRVNRRKGLVAVELAEYCEAAINSLLQMTQLGTWPVTCTQPNRGRFCYGVIGPIDIQSDISALAGRVDTCSSSKFVKMERLCKSVDGNRVPSTSVRVVFEGHELPTRMKIGYLSYSIRAYEFPPLQCYHCQRFGHSAKGCTCKIRCLVCSEEHHFSKCTSKVPKCANCGGPHKANFPHCVRAPRRAEPPEEISHDLNKVRAAGVHRRGALGYHSPQAGRGMRVSAEVHHGLNSPGGDRFSSLTYSQVVRDRSGVDYPVPLDAPAPLLAQASVSALPADFVTNLTNCLADLFSLSLHQESPLKSRSLICAAIQKHFGPALAASSVSESPNVVAPAERANVASVNRVIASGNCGVVASADLTAVASADCAGVSRPITSPTPDDVCSADDEFGSGFMVENFKLVSDSDMSGEDVASGKEWVSVVPGRRSGRDRVSLLSTSTSPNPSPVLSTRRHGPKANGKVPATASEGSTTRRKARSKSRNRQKK